MGRSQKKIKEIYKESESCVSEEHRLMLENEDRKMVTEQEHLEVPQLDNDDNFSEASSNLHCPQSFSVKKPTKKKSEGRKKRN